MTESYFVEAFNHAAALGKRALIVCDVDLALLDTMSRQTTDIQRQLIGDWYDLSGGNLFFMTGRAYQSLDEAWGRYLPGSYEHHSMMRLEENGEVLNLAPQIDTQVIGDHATRLIRLIGQSIRIVNGPDKVHQADGNEFVVYVEIKNAAVALVHSLNLSDDISGPNREFLKTRVAQPLLEQMGLQKTHRVVVGGDAIEIAPAQHSLCELAEDVLPKAEQIRIARDGLGKATGIHNLMGLKGDGFIPFMLGDSPGSDGPAMKICEEYGGYGIGVSNGNVLPDEFLRVTRGKIIPTYQASWRHVEGMVSHLREQPSNVIVLTARKRHF